MFILPEQEKMYDFETGFHLTANSERYAKLLSHYELYKTTINIPGEIVECGVYKGTSITRFAMFRNMFETSDAKKIIGFDNFNSVYPDTEYAQDQKQRENWLKNAGPDSITVKQLSKVFDRLSLKNYEFLEGDLTETLPKYISSNPQLRISLLNIDIDFVEPTYCSLEYLYDRVVPNGIILFDNYGAFYGDTHGIEKFFHERGITPEIQKFPYGSRPCFIRKN